jgi:hypothetical protein
MNNSEDRNASLEIKSTSEEAAAAITASDETFESETTEQILALASKGLKRKSESLADSQLNATELTETSEPNTVTFTASSSQPVVFESLASSREKRVRKLKAYDDDFLTFGPSGSYTSSYYSSSLNAQNGELTASKESLYQSSASNSNINSLAETKFNVCDMVWAKVSGQPWWPCMVSEPSVSSPQTKSPRPTLHAKYVGGNMRPKLMIYVEFFGAAIEHAWVAQNCLIEFKGVEAFKLFAQEQVDAGTTKSGKERLAEKYQLKVTLSKRESWEQAVKEADAALLLEDLNARREIFIKKNLSNHSVTRKSVTKTGDDEEFDEEDAVGEDNSEHNSVGSDSLDFAEGIFNILERKKYFRFYEYSIMFCR